jgi:flagellar biosynthetic protein FliQ
MPVDDTILEFVRTTLILTLKLSAPILLAGVVIGLVISVLQAVTSIQDQTLTFVPKIVAMLLVAVFVLPWVARWLYEFTVQMFSLT